MQVVPQLKRRAQTGTSTQLNNKSSGQINHYYLPKSCPPFINTSIQLTFVLNSEWIISEEMNSITELQINTRTQQHQEQWMKKLLPSVDKTIRLLQFLFSLLSSSFSLSSLSVSPSLAFCLPLSIPNHPHSLFLSPSHSSSPSSPSLSLHLSIFPPVSLPHLSLSISVIPPFSSHLSLSISQSFLTSLSPNSLILSLHQSSRLFPSSLSFYLSIIPPIALPHLAHSIAPLFLPSLFLSVIPSFSPSSLSFYLSAIPLVSLPHLSHSISPPFLPSPSLISLILSFYLYIIPPISQTTILRRTKMQGTTK